MSNTKRSYYNNKLNENRSNIKKFGKLLESYLIEIKMSSIPPTIMKQGQLLEMILT